MTRLSDAAVVRLTEALVVPMLPERYTATEVLARGGMGVIWRARDHLLERDVAVKVLAEQLEGDAWSLGMAQEVRLLAQLEHPGIVAVHDTGILPDGRPWYAMRLVRGVTLADARGEIATQGEALRLVLQLADTIAFAHSHGVIHRDLTPRNIMLGPFGEVLVLDWGLAQPTQPAAIAVRGPVGTPGYMSPEQAAGTPADARTDVYGLGAILRDLLRGLGVPPKSLAAIVASATATDPAERYPDVASLRSDLQRHHDGLPVSVYRETLTDTLQRLVTQYQTPLVLLLSYLTMRLLFLLWRSN